MTRFITELDEQAVQFAPDTNILAFIQRSQQLPAFQALGRLPIIVMADVWYELTGPRVDPAYASPMHSFLKNAAATETEIQPGTPTAAAYAKLQGAVAHIDAGENAIIAYAAHNPPVVPVLVDQEAVARATEELRGRVVGLHQMLRFLRDRHGLPSSTANTVAHYYRTKKLRKGGRPREAPLWWF